MTEFERDLAEKIIKDFPDRTDVREAALASNAIGYARWAYSYRQKEVYELKSKLEIAVGAIEMVKSELSHELNTSMISDLENALAKIKGELCECDDDLPEWQPDWKKNECNLCKKPIVDLDELVEGEIGTVKGFTFIKTTD
jgi:hypothetical protein